MESGIKIIIVEDYPSMRRIIKNCLLELGFSNIFEADDGSTGLEIINRENIDLIIADWDMPNVSGLELLKVLRANDRLKDIPFLMLIKDTYADEISQVLDSETDSYIVKPFTADMLGKKIEFLTGIKD